MHDHLKHAKNSSTILSNKKHGCLNHTYAG